MGVTDADPDSEPSSAPPPLCQRRHTPTACCHEGIRAKNAGTRACRLHATHALLRGRGMLTPIMAEAEANWIWVQEQGLRWSAHHWSHCAHHGSSVGAHYQIRLRSVGANSCPPFTELRSRLHLVYFLSFSFNRRAQTSLYGGSGDYNFLSLWFDRFRRGSPGAA